MQSTTTTTNNLTTSVNVKLLYRECDELDFLHDPLLAEFIGLNFIKMTTDESDSEIDHDWVTPSSKDRFYNLHIQINKFPNEIITSRASFNEKFFKSSGSRINQLLYSPSMKIMPHIQCLREAQNQTTITKDGLDPILKYCTSLVNLDLNLKRLSKGP